MSDVQMDKASGYHSDSPSSSSGTGDIIGPDVYVDLKVHFKSTNVIRVHGPFLPGEGKLLVERCKRILKDHCGGAEAVTKFTRVTQNGLFLSLITGYEAKTSDGSTLQFTTEMNPDALDVVEAIEEARKKGSPVEYVYALRELTPIATNITAIGETRKGGVTIWEQVKDYMPYELPVKELKPHLYGLCDMKMARLATKWCNSMLKDGPEGTKLGHQDPCRLSYFVTEQTELLPVTAIVTVTKVDLKKKEDAPAPEDNEYWTPKKMSEARAKWYQKEVEPALKKQDELRKRPSGPQTSILPRRGP
ncbi:hypothetical protein BU24DRAFT_460202 [Aaosphaeria arxii CBS 175.79]|uniref:Uncharacterized protein n=1 Tax=Aaosphaeria arxii CBS 175.79 TaxID=1450172 RepID=A0A6A5XUY0_9PLEO|nr:uncharacterized protein BU24DRAFT_460202 [Aaosphaeria arxii CBS 175.79]KAF2017118.1 hypothetical protein BU24DRAFT_460202 [Aaosphaeria arxii CBS 175.79]